MNRKLKTKLFKLVCKRSELMREPFRNSSWSNKKTQSDKKALIVNKSGERFRSKIAKLSLGKTWSAIQKVCCRKRNEFYLLFQKKRNGLL
jgi:hypothetical protein